MRRAGDESMKRTPLYSSSPRPLARQPESIRAPEDARSRSAEPVQDKATPPRPPFRVRHQKTFYTVGGGLVVAVAMLYYGSVRGGAQRFTQSDIDAAVLHTLENLPPSPSEEAEAFELVRKAVVRVRKVGNGDGSSAEDAGTGVVVVDDGTILTSLHVVAGAEQLSVVFSDGTESPAVLMTATPEQDLAVLRARRLPDDLQPATLRSTEDLRMGDRVIAVGFPFGIGPSLSGGVVSGLGREYRTPEGDRVLTNLIQFDAAVNPGNSGGPLVTVDGQVVGIVTAILNPLNQRVFIGIGFAVPIERATAATGMSPF
jgi:S1-C subfamily serine protease